MEALDEHERNENGVLSRELPVLLPGVLEIIELIDHLAENP